MRRASSENFSAVISKYIGRIQIAGSKKEEMTMKDNLLPEDADDLLSFGQNLVTVMTEKMDDSRFNREIEALLRASIASATFSINTYMAVLAHAKTSPLAASLLKQARLRCERNVECLRSRITRSITRLCKYLNEDELQHAVKYVLLLAG